MVVVAPPAFRTRHMTQPRHGAQGTGNEVNGRSQQVWEEGGELRGRPTSMRTPVAH